MDFDEAFRIWIETLDASYKRLRAIHSDGQHLSNESKEFKKAFDEFIWIQSQIFQFKTVRHYVESSAYVKELRDNK